MQNKINGYKKKQAFSSLSKLVEVSVKETTKTSFEDGSDSQKDNEILLTTEPGNCTRSNNSKNIDYESKMINAGVAAPIRKRRVMKSYVMLRRKLKEILNTPCLKTNRIDICPPIKKVRDLDRRIY